MKNSALALLLAIVPAFAAPVPYLHVDVSAQPALRNKAALPPLSPGQPVDIALATRGEELLALTSPTVAQRPEFRTDGTAAFLRFDGENDFLALSGPRRLSPAVTVVILASPRKNPGYFRGLFALSEFGKNDYTAGLNLDLGPNATDGLSVLNVESAGAQGARDLLQPGRDLAADLPLGGFHVFTVRSQIKPGGNELWLDGLRLTPRDRLESNIGLDQFVIGARYYSNDPAQQPFIGSFLDGDIAEVLVFDSALDEKDRKEVEARLLAKLPALNAFASGKSGHSLETVKDAPLVQMLVPGFSVSELPVKLTNRNNLRYRHDGKLVALGYDGTIHLLTDTDGDGTEDRAEVFWDRPTLRGPLGIELLKKDDPRGDGVFVTSKGKVSLILDKDRDGRAEQEIIVATGWQEIPQNVDAVGLAVDPKDGSLYFGLGTANYANAYLIDPATGKAAYDIKSERGTIQKVSADFKTRTTVCTGVRFTCALGFNREGDLFATEQEGATWLSNGNPLDELLHIQPGKHYGFPPRHPKHLPDVLDWPAVVEYGPQHQSTVGMVFNDGVNGGPHFGPEFWKGDALVCGEARGKLYRTKLVKTPHGYVGQNHLIACLELLTVDACVSPAGDLLVACHSGPPDWGTGPKGEGRIFKIRYTGKDLPQPVWQWASAPDEFRVAFDRELKPEEWAGLVAAVGVPPSGGSGVEQQRMSAWESPAAPRTLKGGHHTGSASPGQDARATVEPIEQRVALATTDGSRGLQPTESHGQRDVSRQQHRNPDAVASGDGTAREHPSGVADATLSLLRELPWAEAHGYRPLSLPRHKPSPASLVLVEANVGTSTASLRHDRATTGPGVFFPNGELKINQEPPRTAGRALSKFATTFLPGGKALPKFATAFLPGGWALSKFATTFLPGGWAPGKSGVAFQAVGSGLPESGGTSQASEGAAAESGVLIQSNSNVQPIPGKRRVRIEAGRYVSAGDRFEVIRPGYQVVRDQMAAPRRDVEVLGLSLSADRRTIIIRVPRQTEPVGYAVTLPLPESWRQDSAIPQKPEMDVLVTLNGVEVLKPEPRAEQPSAIIPHPSVVVSKAFLHPAAEANWLEGATKAPANPGPTEIVHSKTIKLSGTADLSDLFVPAVQPGASLDWTPARFAGKLATHDGETLRESMVEDDAAKMAEAGGQSFSSFFVSAVIGKDGMSPEQGFYAVGIKEPVPLPARHFRVPWAKGMASKDEEKAVRELPGDWLAGRRVFFSNEAACFTCHQIRGEGIAVGPDLTNLIHRDAESVLADVLKPSATINPNHPASTVTLKGGAKLTGIVRTANAQEVKVALQGGAVQTLAAGDVAGTELLKTSFMPEGYAERLTKEQQGDLLKFLLVSPLEPAPVERAEPAPPKARTRAEVEGVLNGKNGSKGNDGTALKSQSSHALHNSPLRILLAAGPKDHGPGEHDYPLWQKRWATLLALAPGVTVDTSWEFPSAEKLASADVTVFYSKNPGFNPRTAMLLDDYQNRGGGLVYLHWALNGDEHAQVLAERIGLAGGRTGVAYRHGEFDLVFTQPEHPVTKGFPTLHFTDETYWKLVGDTARINILGTGVEEGAPQPQLWSMERGKGRVIGCVPGHYTWTFDDPLYRALVLRAICWTAKQEDVDRLAELAIIGARISP